ncbi:MAG: 16S rRNA (adenine(1518)-N(6)/adenine(1519)-N(6))-dimethyltransferase RsmA [Chromatiales bacterium]|jgi:16S rRNA (adenine1518-N6/adenine1519-N6)-dimethyltransferase
MHHRPRKRFGQNFLHDPAVIARILRAVDPVPGDHLVEIGPGRGAITAGLLEGAGELDAVELDRDLVAPLARLCGGLGRLRIHTADALRFEFCTLAPPGERLRLVGNLPYNISTPLLFHLLDQARCIADMHFMLQKEVVERMAAGPGTKTYGRLSVMLQTWCEVTDLFAIGPDAFTPPPKVHSALVRLRPLDRPRVAVCDPDVYARVVGLAFGQRRKTLRNALAPLMDASQIAAAGVEPGERAERLGLEAFSALADAACKSRRTS